MDIISRRPRGKMLFPTRRAAPHLVLLALSAASLFGCGVASRNADPADAAPMLPVAHQDNAKEEAPPAKPNQVAIDNFRFSPRTLTVPAGTKVTWVNRDDVPHTATSTVKPRAFDSGALDTDQTFSHVFAALGEYEYFCAVHPHMTGRVVVK